MATTGILYTLLKTFQPQGMGGARNAAQSTDGKTLSETASTLQSWTRFYRRGPLEFPCPWVSKTSHPAEWRPLQTLQS